MAPSTRARSNSVKAVLEDVRAPSVVPAQNAVAPVSQAPAPVKAKATTKSKPAVVAAPASFFGDLLTGKWIVNPVSSFKIIAIVALIWAGFEYVPASTQRGLNNPVRPLLFISYPLTRNLTERDVHYQKGALDLAFIAFYIVIFSFIRQTVTGYVVKPFAKACGIRGESKLLRFMEQGYAMIYFMASGSIGLYVMSRQKTWWYETQHFWLEYPHWRMAGELKFFYLFQFSYWLQQMLILVLKLEKPRSDFFELIIHHCVTLWLVGWSYTLNLTMIGVAVFVSMDVPDVFLAFSKCLNYLELQRTSEVSFVVFMAVWHYMRHYLNFKILFSVWTEFDLIPVKARTFDTAKEGYWLAKGVFSGRIPPWMRYHIFAPILILGLVNIFWSYLIWRIIIRMIKGTPATDTREEGEDSDEEVEPVDSKKKR